MIAHELAREVETIGCEAKRFRSFPFQDEVGEFIAWLREEATRPASDSEASRAAAPAAKGGRKPSTRR